MATSTSIIKAVIGISILLIFSGLVSADYYYNDGSSDELGSSDWGTLDNIPEFDNHEEIVYEFVAPFLFVFVVLQFSLRKALEFTFDNDNNRPAPWEDDGADVTKEATIMALAITMMLVASPYWSLIQTMAAGIGLLAVGTLILIFLFLIYLFVS
ncbi:MAG: hypothetical protein V5A72_03400 [Candidatus Nanohaloarchaea archaeon]